MTQSVSLPAGVHEKHGSYYLVRSEAGRRKWHRLSRIDDGTAALYRALAELEVGEKGTLGYIIDQYLLHGTGALAKRTQDEYARSASRLRRVFGKMPAELVEPTHIAQYLYESAQAGAPVQGNRDVACLRSVFQFGMRLGLCRADPCRGVARNPERPRERYISDEELLAAIEAATPEFGDVLWTAYLTGLRQGDLRSLQKEQVSREGITVRESKRGKRMVVTWSPALRGVIDAACARHPESEFILNNTRGEPWSLWAVQSAMRRLKVDWTFHDLRAKAESDHRTGLGLLARYQRAKRVTPVG